jgi:PmbA protein
MNRKELAEQLVERALKSGAQDAEAFVAESASVEIEIRDAAVETVEYKNLAGYGMRVLIDGKMGFASSNNVDLKKASDVIARLVKYTSYHSPDEHNVLPESGNGADIDHSLDHYDEAVLSTPVEKKIEVALAIESLTRQSDKRIIHIPYLQYGDEAVEYTIVSSRGVSGEARRTEVYGAAMAAAMNSGADGNPDPATIQTGVGIDVVADFGKLNPEEVAHKASTYALRMLGAVDGSTAEMTGVFPPETGYSFIKLVADMVAADLVQKKKSLYADRINETVASDLITIIDDGRMKGGLGSIAVDAEGVPSAVTPIMDKGRLVGFLHDSYTAHRGNAASTGNAKRSSFDTRPYIAPTNFYLATGTITRDALVGSVTEGLYVTEVSGLHASVDRVTGHFSIPGKGILIDNGELTRPVANITISGNVFDFFKGIDAVADDLTWEKREDTIGTPIFRVKAIKISGK